MTCFFRFLMFDIFVCLQDIKEPFLLPKDNVKLSKSNDVVSCENRICSFYRLLNFCILVCDMPFLVGSHIIHYNQRS